jgi:hypothetical protein
MIFVCFFDLCKKIGCFDCYFKKFHHYCCYFSIWSFEFVALFCSFGRVGSDTASGFDARPRLLEWSRCKGWPTALSCD